ncbi:MAG: TauD/TfdA dioxygenase family protein [Thiolinea sp.]
MDLQLSYVSPVLGVYLEGLEITPGNLQEAAIQIRHLLDQHLVVIIRQQHLSPVLQRDLVGQFGPLFLHHADEGVIYADSIKEVLEMRKEPDGTRLFGGSDWHADVTFQNPAAYVSALQARILPPLGGDTGFASNIAAFEALTPAMQEMLTPLSAVHSYDGPHAPDHPTQTATHPIVRTHPVSGKKGLYINHMFAKRFSGMNEYESRPLIEFLDRHMSKPEFTFRHRWQQGDLVFWDNRFTLHYPINDFTGHLRLLLRCTALES